MNLFLLYHTTQFHLFSSVHESKFTVIYFYITLLKEVNAVSSMTTASLAKSLPGITNHYFLITWKNFGCDLLLDFVITKELVQKGEQNYFGKTKNSVQRGWTVCRRNIKFIVIAS